jgi:vacuolar protein sorting-associated protein 13A/C
LSARERLDLNLSTTFVELAITTFVELAITTLSAWNKGEHILQKARGTYAPYRIRNQTGAPIFVWSDTDGSANTKDIDVVKILHDQIIDWRFDDWKTMREVSDPQNFITSPI